MRQIPSPINKAASSNWASPRLRVPAMYKAKAEDRMAGSTEAAVIGRS